MAMGLGPIAALLLIPAALLRGGEWPWPRGLAFIAAFGGVTLAGNLILALNRPAHFQVRQQGIVASADKKQPLIDAAGVAVLAALTGCWLAFIPFDVFRLHMLPPPAPWVSMAGGLAVVVGAMLTPLAVWENRFAAPNVQDQTAQGQRIVETGVYRYIRHPIYLGNLLLVGGLALWLGSVFAALLGLAVQSIATVGRIVVEERELRARLPDYAAYQARVRARLIPFLL